MSGDGDAAPRPGANMRFSLLCGNDLVVWVHKGACTKDSRVSISNINSKSHFRSQRGLPRGSIRERRRRRSPRHEGVPRRHGGGADRASHRWLPSARVGARAFSTRRALHPGGYPSPAAAARPSKEQPQAKKKAGAHAGALPYVHSMYYYLYDLGVPIYT